MSCLVTVWIERFHYDIGRVNDLFGEIGVGQFGDPTEWEVWFNHEESSLLEHEVENELFD